MSDGRKQFEKKFRQGGYRLTSSRRIILDILHCGSKPLSVDDIYLAIKAKKENVGLTTIYRAVNGLVKAGLLRKIVSSADQFRYELSGGRACDHHHQLVCRKCDLLTEYKDFSREEIRLIERIEKLVSEKHDFEVDDHQICFMGICKQCRKGNKKREGR